MSEPVLVVHGVANRKRPAFEDLVGDLADRVAGDYRFIPVFWGDLGAQTESIRDSLPDMTSAAFGPATVDPALLQSILGTTDPNDTVRSHDAQQETIVRGATTQLDGSSTVRGSDPAQPVREAVQATLPTTRYIQFIQDPALLEAIGRAVGTAAQAAQDGATTTDPGAATSGPAITRGDPYGIGTSGNRGPYDTIGPYGDAGGGADTRGLFDGVRNIAQKVLTELDNVIGTAVGTALGRANQQLRGAFGVKIVEFIGDVLVYQRNAAEIQQRLWSAIAQHAPGYGTEQQPINVVAHSLGGVITFDTAVRGQPPLWIKNLVTCGSQPALFHLIDPRVPQLAEYATQRPVTLPPHIQRWTNLWEYMDPLAFSTERVFKLATGHPPQDLPVGNPAHVLMESYGFTHGTYWRSDALVQAIREAFSA